MRVLITGPECTGKSTLAKKLSQELGLPHLQEYAREYLSELKKPYEELDLLKIAQAHYKILHTFPADQSMILDTYLLNIKLWSLFKYQQVHPWIQEQVALERHFDFIFLMYPDLPWKQDGLRENENNSLELFNLFEMELQALQLDYHIIKGLAADRMHNILKHFD